jgi:hypothetical protein
VKRLFINGHHVRNGYCVILEETGECIAFINARLPFAQKLVERFNRWQQIKADREKQCATKR